jgi:hypothetical protein
VAGGLGEDESAAAEGRNELRVDDQHYVRDGHDRVSVARALGESAIDAGVVRLGSRR